MDWEEIKTLRAVVTHRTVRAAADALGIHHTTIGRRIEALEKTVGTGLFNRTPDGLLLTPAGERLFTVADAFNEALIGVESSIAGLDGALSGQLSVTIPEPVLNAVFLPELEHFTAQHPDIELIFDGSLDLRDVARREADIAVRLDNNPPDALVGKRLYAYCDSIYARPDYLEKPRDQWRWLGWDDTPERHPDWVRQTAFPDVPVWNAFPSIASQQIAARAGLGLTQLPCLFGDADPNLVRATSRPPVKRRDIWLLTHNDLRRTARVQAFILFAERVLRANRARMEGLAS